METDKLSTREHWTGRWSKRRLDKIGFDPEGPVFKDLHRLFTKVLPADGGRRFLEVGCHPGHYMWYFHRFFGYEVSGLEYVETFCDRTRRFLEAGNVPGEVICNDLFAFAPSSQEKLWDVVASFGFIEHFQDTAGVMKRHLDLLKDGGYLVFVIPNHSGIYGRILKFVSPGKHSAHNLMRYEDMLAALKKIGNLEIIEGGYYGRLGFWATGIYARAKALGRFPYLLVRTPLWVLERAGRLLPNSPLLSPNAAVIVRKPGGPAINVKGGKTAG